MQVIAEQCFFGSGLTNATIPASVREIENDAFRNCKDLSELKFEKKSQIKKIGTQAFSDTALKVVSVPPAA